MNWMVIFQGCWLMNLAFALFLYFDCWLISAEIQSWPFKLFPWFVDRCGHPLLRDALLSSLWFSSVTFIYFLFLYSVTFLSLKVWQSFTNQESSLNCSTHWLVVGLRFGDFQATSLVFLSIQHTLWAKHLLGQYW